MALEVQDTQIDGVKGETNIWDLDASIPLDAGQDSVWFTLKQRKSDLDADAVAQYGLNVAGLAGIAVTDAPAGRFRVTSPLADLAAVAGRALVFDVKVKIDATGTVQTVASGVLYLVEPVNKDAA